MHARLAASSLVLVVLCVGCGQSGPPTSPTSSAAITSTSSDAPGGSIAIPFKGRLEGEGDPPVFEPPPSPFFSAHLVASGNATLLGRFTLDFSHRVNLNTLVGIGDAALTAANGDALLTHVEGQAMPAGSPTAFTVVETHTVTGGTGRFEGASGSFVVTRAVDFANPFTSGSIEGSIFAPSGKF